MNSHPPNNQMRSVKSQAVAFTEKPLYLRWKTSARLPCSLPHIDLLSSIFEILYSGLYGEHAGRCHPTQLMQGRRMCCCDDVSLSYFPDRTDQTFNVDVSALLLVNQILSQNKRGLSVLWASHSGICHRLVIHVSVFSSVPNVTIRWGTPLSERQINDLPGEWHWCMGRRINRAMVWWRACDICVTPTNSRRPNRTAKNYDLAETGVYFHRVSNDACSREATSTCSKIST